MTVKNNVTGLPVFIGKQVPGAEVDLQGALTGTFTLRLLHPMAV